MKGYLFTDYCDSKVSPIVIQCNCPFFYSLPLPEKYGEINTKDSTKDGTFRFICKND